jgi:hypothetical protein
VPIIREKQSLGTLESDYNKLTRYLVLSTRATTLSGRRKQFC